MMTVLLGFSALAFDVGVMYNTKADLQRAADASALAAASRLAEYDAGDPLELARNAAHQYIAQNPVFGQTLVLDESDIEFGRAVYDSVSESYTFTPGTSYPDAVRIRVRMTEDSSNGAAPLYFARIFGKENTNIWAEAVAVMVPRDIAIVADLSGSHNDDSDLHEVWDALSRWLEPDPTYGEEYPMAGADEENGGIWGSSYACTGAECEYQRGGPAWGLLKELEWGDDMGVEGYDPSTDPGLVYLPKYSDWSSSFIEDALAAQGYIQPEIDALVSAAHDGDGAHTFRTAAALGLARWNSGIEGGLWEQLGMPPDDAGNGNDWVGGTEMTWLERFGDRDMGTSANYWKDWINRTTGPFGQRYGLKSFVSFLLENKDGHWRTPELSVTPEQPMQAVKDAVVHMVTTVEDLETDDQMSLEIYGTTARHEIDLTHEYHLVSDRLNGMQAAHYDNYTNMGGGIETAIAELNSERVRRTARRVMILLTDGRANVNRSGRRGDYSGGQAYALEAAQAAADDGIMIFAVSVGNNADTSLMEQIATIGGGEHFRAEGSIEEYSEELTDIFNRLGGTRPVELIK